MATKYTITLDKGNVSGDNVFKGTREQILDHIGKVLQPKTALARSEFLVALIENQKNWDTIVSSDNGELIDGLFGQNGYIHAAFEEGHAKGLAANPKFLVLQQKFEAIMDERNEQKPAKPRASVSDDTPQPYELDPEMQALLGRITAIKPNDAMTSHVTRAGTAPKASRTGVGAATLAFSFDNNQLVVTLNENDKSRIVGRIPVPNPKEVGITLFEETLVSDGGVRKGLGELLPGILARKNGHSPATTTRQPSENKNDATNVRISYDDKDMLIAVQTGPETAVFTTPKTDKKLKVTLRGEELQTLESLAAAKAESIGNLLPK